MAYWLDSIATPPNWLEIEKEACHSNSIGAILLAPYTIEKSLYNNNVMIHNTIRIWKQIRAHFKLKSIFYALPITGNPTFPPSTLDNTFYLWKNRGIHTIELYIKGVFASFAQLQGKYNLPGSSFFRYLQIRDYVRTHKTCLDGCLRPMSCSEK